jgi:hypothetical protein
MIHMHVLKHFWSDVVLTACYLINWMPSSVLNGAAPHSILFPHSPLFFLPPRIFGCICCTHNLGLGLGKVIDATILFFYNTLLVLMVTFFESQPYFSDTSSHGDSLFDTPLTTPNSLSPGLRRHCHFIDLLPYRCTLDVDDHPPSCSHQLP